MIINPYAYGRIFWAFVNLPKFNLERRMHKIATDFHVSVI